MVSARAANSLGGRTLALKPSPDQSSHLTIGHWVYRFLSTTLMGPVLLWLWWRGFKETGYRHGLAERLGLVTPDPSARGGLWVHVASVGEAQAALTLLPSLQQEWGLSAITWTTQTPAAKDFLRDRTQGQVEAWFAPMDTPVATQLFLRRVQPRMLLLLERELWPEWLWQCERHAVTVVVANARLKAGSIQRWPYNTHWLGSRLQRLQLALCADPGTAVRFKELGLPADRVFDFGNLKFDQQAPVCDVLSLGQGLQDRTVVVAASTHAADEDAILAGWASWTQNNPQALLVLAPRHPQRFVTLANQLASDWRLRPNEGLAIRSKGHAITQATRLVLWDTIGELTQLYPYAKICLMGGTWSRVGGHNALEPLAAGCPVLFGPHTHQFPDLYEQMLISGAARQVDPPDIWANVQACLTEQGLWSEMRSAGLAFVQAQQGSAKRTLEQLKQLNCWPQSPMAALLETGSMRAVVWTNSVQSCALTEDAFELSNYGQMATGLATGSGRGQAHRVERDEQSWVLRHYRRGGWVGRFNTDRYPAAITAYSRGMQELVLLREMTSLGLPVPEGVAARCVRQLPWMGKWSPYRADILVNCIPNTHNLAQWLNHNALTPQIWNAVGHSIAQLHKHQVHHSDLNCHNILLNEQGQVWLIDFDKCERRPGNAWKARNLSRLLRSLRKESVRRQGFCWEEANWTTLLGGYEQAQT
jgi:3-deoxy-D-manno-octulosonic-acid transferase